jgi:hypothetical protein
MKDKNFSLYKTLYLTRRDPYELSDHRKIYFQKFYCHDNFVNGEIELGKRYRVEVFSILESWKLEINDYLHFFESHKENLIGAQVSDVNWYDLGVYIGKQADRGVPYRPLNDNLWVDSLKKCWVPSIDFFGMPFYFYLGCIDPDFDADQNCVFLFYPFKEGTEDLYIPFEEKTEDLYEPTVHKEKKHLFSFLWKLFR